MTRIMTYNVHGCVGVDRRLDVARIAAVIAQSEPDIVALQELDVCRSRSGHVDQAHAIAARLGMAYHFHPAFEVAEERYGDALLSTLPLRLVKAGPLPTPRVRGLEMRGALWAAVEIDGAEVNILNTHLGLVPLEQRGQMACLLGKDWIGAAQGPTLLIGDFNATSHYACYAQALTRLQDGQRQVQKRKGQTGRALPTFPSRYPVLRIDHVFVNDGIEVIDVHTPNGPLARAASDHLPLVADFRVR